jgi:hypothetical protein
VLRELPPIFRRDHIGWGLTPELLRRRNPDLSLDDTSRVRHMLSAESGAARRDVLAGVPVDRDALSGVPALVLSGELDALYPAADAERVAAWVVALRPRDRRGDARAARRRDPPLPGGPQALMRRAA